FGEAKPVDEITFDEVRALVIKLKRSGAKSKSISLWVANLRSTLNYAITKGLLRQNVINKLSSPSLKKIIGSTKAIKPPMDMAAIDKAAAVIKHPVDRAWYNVARFTGMRKDECNRLQWHDINFDLAMIHIPGTKTADSDAWLPLAPVALETLRALRKQSDPNCPWVFPGRSPRTKGKKVYSRRRLFELIQKKTGIHLRPKDLRDYFATEVASKVNDPTVIMKLLRHTNLKTTTGYLRTVEDRMRAAVENLGQRETKPKHTLSSDHN